MLSTCYGTFPQEGDLSIWWPVAYPGPLLAWKVLWLIQTAIELLSTNCLSCPPCLSQDHDPRVCFPYTGSQYSRVVVRVNLWQRDTAVLPHSRNYESEQQEVDSCGHRDSLSTCLCKEGFISLNAQVLSTPSGIASATENSTSYGGPHPAADPGMSQKFQPSHSSELGPFQLQSSVEMTKSDLTSASKLSFSSPNFFPCLFFHSCWSQGHCLINIYEGGTPK